MIYIFIPFFWIFLAILFAVSGAWMILESIKYIFFIVLALTIVCWIASFIFEKKRLFQPFKFFYDLFFLGRIVSIALGVAALVIHFILP